jgi:hypothetical protein
MKLSKKFSKICILFLFLSVFTGGCASSGSSDNQIELTDYNFTMYGKNGIKLASGVMTVKNIISKDVNNPSISGTYVLTSSEGDFPGKSAMNGEFAGNMDYNQGKLFINTNPKIADANVFFNATMYSSFYQGEWSYSTFRGPTDRGELKITKAK